LVRLARLSLYFMKSPSAQFRFRIGHFVNSLSSFSLDRLGVTRPPRLDRILAVHGGAEWRRIQL